MADSLKILIACVIVLYSFGISEASDRFQLIPLTTSYTTEGDEHQALVIDATEKRLIGCIAKSPSPYSPGAISLECAVEKIDAGAISEGVAVSTHLFQPGEANNPAFWMINQSDGALTACISNARNVQNHIHWNCRTSRLP